MAADMAITMEKNAMLIRVVSMIVFLLLFAGVGYGQSHIGVPKSSTSFRMEDMNSIELKLRLLQRQPDKWEFELTLHNGGKHPLFFMTDPTRSDRSSGPYISLDANDISTLDISARLYLPPIYSLYVNDAHVKLKRIEPNTTHSEIFTIGFPLKETIPPYGETPERHIIDHTKIKFIKASIGILPDDEGVRDILEHKPAGPFVYGLEKIM
ncbi:MAG TPA: hypothetical protein VNI77_05320, partial [Nitrososphaera sp.]|nr:hypothetical protein [Nitrososphaera sp.]